MRCISPAFCSLRCHPERLRCFVVCVGCVSPLSLVPHPLHKPAPLKGSLSTPPAGGAPFLRCHPERSRRILPAVRMKRGCSHFLAPTLGELSSRARLRGLLALRFSYLVPPVLSLPSRGGVCPADASRRRGESVLFKYTVSNRYSSSTGKVPPSSEMSVSRSNKSRGCG